jgi:hypothetical protein
VTNYEVQSAMLSVRHAIDRLRLMMGKSDDHESPAEQPEHLRKRELESRLRAAGLSKAQATASVAVVFDFLRPKNGE